MELLIGLGIGLVFFACFVIAFYLGYRLGQKQRKPEQPEVTDEQRERAKKAMDAFQKLMNYDVETALKRKKVE